jgi:hypothetical protein
VVVDKVDGNPQNRSPISRNGVIGVTDCVVLRVGEDRPGSEKRREKVGPIYECRMAREQCESDLLRSYPNGREDFGWGESCVEIGRVMDRSPGVNQHPVHAGRRRHSPQWERVISGCESSGERSGMLR